MKLAPSRLRERVIAAQLLDWPRILPTRRRATPAGAGFGSSRFSSPTDAFRVLYAADNFPTAFAEAVVRDRFEGKSRRYLYRLYLEQVCLTVERLAIDAGVDRAWVSELEREQGNTSVDLLDRLAEALGVSIAALFAEPEPDAHRPQPLRSGRRPRD